MGTRFHVVFPGMDEKKGYRMLNLIQKEVERIEAKLSFFKKDSEITKINRQASKESVKLSTELYEILKICRDYSITTNGAFSISLRPLLQYWKNEPENSTSVNGFKNLLTKLDMDNIILNDSNKTVKFDNEDVEIDLGGFGKGYALEKVKSMLEEFSIQTAFISFGESSVLTIGNHPAGNHWKVGMKNYFNPEEALHTFHIKNGSVSTSGNFYVDDNGVLQNHRHVINPFTGYPVEDIVTVSVCAGSAMVAEILSTAFLILPDDEIQSITSKMEDISTVKATYISGKPVITILE